MFWTIVGALLFVFVALPLIVIVAASLFPAVLWIFRVLFTEPAKPAAAVAPPKPYHPALVVAFWTLMSAGTISIASLCI
jgi:hypothetical protein